MKRPLQALLFVVGGIGCDAAPLPTPSQTTNTAPATAAPAEELTPPPPVDSDERAAALAHDVIILDGHVDVPYRLQELEDPRAEDLSVHGGEGDFDIPRARAGGLDAPFMSIYTPAKLEKTGGSKKLADELIDLVESFVARWPQSVAIARTPGDVRKNYADGKISLPMGMENGSPIEGKLENLSHFHRRGIRYITLAHSKDNHIADSSYDDRHTHRGLSKFGKKVVAEMNRLGIMVDVSHISDEAFWQVMEISKVPVIASHSSCRHYTPGFERNMSDEMIEALAKNGGVIQINFGSGFLDGEFRAQSDARRRKLLALLESKGLERHSPKAKPIEEAFEAEHPLEVVDIGRVADHIEHVVALVGIDHVGLGSDFDGVGDTLPRGLEDVSKYPQLVEVLLERGLSEADIAKVCGANVLRVWGAVEAHARGLAETSN